MHTHHHSIKPKHEPKLHRKDGYFYIVFYNPRCHPTRKWVPLGTKKPNLAQIEYSRLSTAYYQGYDPWAKMGSTSVSHAVDRFLAHKRLLLKETRSLIEVLEPFATHYGKREISSLNQDEILAFTIRRGYKPNTNKRRMTTMRSFLKWTEERYGPLASVTWPRIRAPKDPGCYLNKAECRLIDDRFRTICENPDAHAFRYTWEAWKLGVFSGLRPVDLCRLEKTDIDWDNKLINIRGSKYDGWVIPIFPGTEEVLRRRSAECKQFVFENAEGKVLKPDWISHFFRCTIKSLDIQSVTLYQATRHTFASWLVQGGVELYQVSKWLGHKAIRLRLTMRI